MSEQDEELNPQEHLTLTFLDMTALVFTIGGDTGLEYWVSDDGVPIFTIGDGVVAFKAPLIGVKFWAIEPCNCEDHIANEASEWLARVTGPRQGEQD